MLVSKAIGMADDVQKDGYGVVVDRVTKRGVETAVSQFRQQYSALAYTAQQARQTFSQAHMIQSFLDVYEAVTL